MTSGWCLCLPLILFPLLSLSYSLHILSPTSLSTPFFPSSFLSFLSPFSISSFFLLTICAGYISHSRTVTHTSFKLFSVSLFSIRSMFYLNAPLYSIYHMSFDMTASHRVYSRYWLNSTSVCVLTGDYILPPSSDRTVQCGVLWQSPPHEIVYSWLAEAVFHIHFFFTFRHSNLLRDRVSPHIRSLVNSSIHESQNGLGWGGAPLYSTLVHSNAIQLWDVNTTDEKNKTKRVIHVQWWRKVTVPHFDENMWLDVKVKHLKSNKRRDVDDVLLWAIRSITVHSPLLLDSLLCRLL